MRSKTVQRFYCDHCNKGGFKRALMERHERTCFSNPKRQCPLCSNKPEHKVREYSQIMVPVETVEAECPHCLLAVLIQGNTGQDYSEMTYYAKEQLLKDLISFREQHLRHYMWMEELHDVRSSDQPHPFLHWSDGGTGS